MNNRDDFSEKIKNILKDRVGGRCSNPACQIETVCPNSKDDKRTNIGIAAHITAASPEGPRYDNKLSQEERSSVTNGIWLCSNCANLIDKDEAKYPVNLLKSWKEGAEKKQQERFDNNKVKTINKEDELKALKELSSALYDFISFFKIIYDYWEKEFSRLPETKIERELTEKLHIYIPVIKQFDCIYLKQEQIQKIISDYNILLPVEIIELTKNIIDTVIFHYDEDCFGYNNKWFKFFEMVKDNYEPINELYKKQLQPLLKTTYSNLSK